MGIDDDKLINDLISDMKEVKPTMKDYQILGIYFIKLKLNKIKDKIKRILKRR